MTSDLRFCALLLWWALWLDQLLNLSTARFVSEMSLLNRRNFRLTASWCAFKERRRDVGYIRYGDIKWINIKNLLKNARQLSNKASIDPTLVS